MGNGETEKRVKESEKLIPFEIVIPGALPILRDNVDKKKVEEIKTKEEEKMRRENK